jgi:hypothetical protein
VVRCAVWLRAAYISPATVAVAVFPWPLRPAALSSRVLWSLPPQAASPARGELGCLKGLHSPLHPRLFSGDLPAGHNLGDSEVISRAGFGSSAVTKTVDLIRHSLIISRFLQHYLAGV